MAKYLGLVLDERFLTYETAPFSPENPERIAHLYEQLKGGGWYHLIEPRMASTEELALVHGQAYIEEVRGLSVKGGRLAPDTWIAPGGFEISALAAGGVIKAVEETVKGKLNMAFALVRPPGHHASRDKGMGFCVFNSVAIGAKYALEALGVKKVLVVDWDVHHGNGTQEIFYADPRVLYFSIHQYPFFPDSGYFDEVGEGEGKGYTVNVPLPIGCTDVDYSNIFRRLLLPLASEFEPELVIVSAGFDPHQLDPLGGMNLSEKGFGRLTQLVLKVAEELCNSKVVFVLEGGHHPYALSRSVFEVLRLCCEKDLALQLDFEQREDENYYKIKPFIQTVKECLQNKWKI